MIWGLRVLLRLDGSTNKFVRELDIRDFNNDNTCYFVYLISTRAGGLGINLTAANHVVIYDHDWNPFIDLQAVDRSAFSLLANFPLTLQTPGLLIPMLGCTQMDT